MLNSEATMPDKKNRGDEIIIDEFQVAQEQFKRYEFARDNGHLEYVESARKCYRMYRGAGQQWTKDDKEYIESVQGRKAVEINGILPAVQTATGEQINTRVDIAYKPAKGEATQELATILTKLAKHILDQNGYPRREKQVYKDGLIKRRGYFDVRMQFDDNLQGEIEIRDLDPYDVIPDPYAQSYDPKDWSEWMYTRWLSLDQIEQFYGQEARVRVERYHPTGDSEESWGRENKNDDGDGRTAFGSVGQRTWDAQFTKATGERMIRVIERQYRKWDMQLHFVDPATGDRRPVPQAMDKGRAQEFAQANGLTIARFNTQRVRWRVTTSHVVLHDEWCPYKNFTIIPFFYIFDRGDTLSMVDNAISPQEVQNKMMSSYLHIINSISNSGWITEEGSLTNMSEDELTERGMKTGLHIVVKKGSAPPQKIQPNPVPTGIDRAIERGEYYIKTTTGISDAELGMNSPEVSGVAIQSKQFQAKLQMADSLDNLEFTRKLLADRILELIQQYYTAPRIYKITGKDPATGKDTEEELAINQPDAAGQIVNDVTLGEYAVVVSTTPMAATFEDSQFNQAMEMRQRAGVAIPDDELIRLSNLANKYDLAERITNPQDDGAQQAQLQMLQLQMQKLAGEIGLLAARRQSEIARATSTNVQAMFGATNAAREIVTTPGVSPVADELMLSAGFEDANGGQVIPPATQQQMPPQQQPVNTSPNFPPQADRGAMTGIEGGRQ